MFSKSAVYYDTIYSALGKDYEREAQLLYKLIQQHKRSQGNSLLDIACGTGSHLKFLQRNYEVEGLDLNKEFLQIARDQLKNVPLHQADMIDFQLDHQFDVVTCLFSSIGYVKSKPRLHQAIQNIQRHTRPGGLVIIEPWKSPTDFYPGYLHAAFVDQPELKIARMNVSQVEGNLSILNFHYLVATESGVEHFTERHEMGLFSADEYLAAFEESGLETIYNPEGLMGRGLYLGINGEAKPEELVTIAGDA